jgi:hypothetical protein
MYWWKDGMAQVISNTNTENRDMPCCEVEQEKDGLSSQFILMGNS